MLTGITSLWKGKAQSSLPNQTKAMPPALQSYLHHTGQAVWSERRYESFASEGYIKNVIAHRAVTLIATAASNIPFRLFAVMEEGQRQELKQHPLLSLLAKPSQQYHRASFIEALVTYRMISGNGYILAVGPEGEIPKELHLLRPDRMTIIAGRNGYPAAYRHQCGAVQKDYPVHPVSGLSRILHLKAFHPLNDYYGLSPMEAAAHSIDMHNNSSNWNQALLQNSARPSGALIVKSADSKQGGHLSEDQYWRIKNQIDEQFSGYANAGRPLLLEGGAGVEGNVAEPEGYGVSGSTSQCGAGYRTGIWYATANAWHSWR